MTDLSDTHETFILLCLEKANDTKTHDLRSAKKPNLKTFHSFVDDSAYVFADLIMGYIADSKACKNLYARENSKLETIVKPAQYGNGTYYSAHTITYVFGAYAFSENEARFKLKYKNDIDSNSTLVQLRKSYFLPSARPKPHDEDRWYMLNYEGVLRIAPDCGSFNLFIKIV